MRRRPKKRQQETMIFNLLGDYEKILNLSSVPLMQKEQAVKSGILKDQLICLKTIIDLDYYRIADMLAITERTIHLKKEDETFSHIISDRIMFIAEIYCFGYNAVGSQHIFNTWMIMPNKQFDGKSPIELMGTLVGGMKVRNEITRHLVGAF